MKFPDGQAALMVLDVSLVGPAATLNPAVVVVAESGKEDTLVLPVVKLLSSDLPV